MNAGLTHHSSDATIRNCGYYHLKGKLILYINFFLDLIHFFPTSLKIISKIWGDFLTLDEE